MNDIALQIDDHAALPDIATAPLPRTYEAAKQALAACVDLDECQMWANRAEALASYARQSKDEALKKMSDRIQARAIDRCGEIMRETKPGKPGPKIDGGTPTQLGRFKMAEQSGLSRDQAVTALRVNNVSRDQFERLVESDNPPTITALAKLGTTKRPTGDPPDYLKGREPADFETATHLIGLGDDILKQVKAIDMAAALRGLDQRERDEAITTFGECIKWLTEIHEVLRNGL